jgi:hypothetical protein
LRAAIGVLTGVGVAAPAGAAEQASCPMKLPMMVARAAPAMMFGIVLLCAGPAVAQFGGLFDPPRPPGNVPTRPPAQAQPAPANPQLLPPGPPPGRPGIQSEDLPPPGGAQPAALPRPGSAPPPAQPLPLGQQPPPGQRQPPQQRAGTPPANAPAGAVAGPPPPPEDVITPPPPQRITNPSAVFSGLDKITGRITTFDAAIGETVQFGALQVTARACYSRPPTETPLTDGFVEVDEVTLQGEVRRIFTGWMFAASPGLHAVEHAIYDVWLIDCKGGAQAVADAQPAAPAATPPRQGAQQRQGGAQQRQPAAGQQPPAPRQTLPPPSGTLAQPGTFNR